MEQSKNKRQQSYDQQKSKQTQCKRTAVKTIQPVSPVSNIIDSNDIIKPTANITSKQLQQPFHLQINYNQKERTIAISHRIKKNSQHSQQFDISLFHYVLLSTDPSRKIYVSEKHMEVTAFRLGSSAGSIIREDEKFCIVQYNVASKLVTKIIQYKINGSINDKDEEQNKEIISQEISEKISEKIVKIIQNNIENEKIDGGNNAQKQNKQLNVEEKLQMESLEKISQIDIQKQGQKLDSIQLIQEQENNLKKSNIESVMKDTEIYVKQKTLYLSRNIADVPVKLEQDCRLSRLSRLSTTNTINNKISIRSPAQLTAHQIQLLLQYAENHYGQLFSINVRRNTLIITVKQSQQVQNIESTIKNKNHKLQQDRQINSFIISKKTSIITRNNNMYNSNISSNNDHQSSINSAEASRQYLRLKYYTITENRPIYNTKPSKLIQLPPETKIRHVLLFQQWVILGTNSDVLFLHLYRPMQSFITISKLKTQNICKLGEDRVILLSYKYLHIYKIKKHKQPTLITVIKIRKLQPFSLCQSGNDILISGIDHSYLLNSRLQQKYIHSIQSFITMNLQNKQSIIVDESMLICSHQQLEPIRNIVVILAVQSFVCSCGNNIYLGHFQSKSILAQVQLNGGIGRIRQISHCINMVNIIVMVTNYKDNKEQNNKIQSNKLIHIGFDEYCEQIGSQVSCLQYGDHILDYCYLKKAEHIIVNDGENLRMFSNGTNSNNSNSGRLLYHNNNVYPNNIKKLQNSLIQMQIPVTTIIDKDKHIRKSSQQISTAITHHNSNFKQQQQIRQSSLYNSTNHLKVKKYSTIKKLCADDQNIIFVVDRNHTVEINMLEL